MRKGVNVQRCKNNFMGMTDFGLTFTALCLSTYFVFFML